MAAPPAGQLEPAERGKHDAEGRRRALVEAAMTVFAEHGYDCATTRTIAERSGCAEGLIHRYFGGKRGLLIAILENKADAVAELFRISMPDRESLAEEIEQLLVSPLAIMWDQQDFMRVSVSQSVIDPEVGRTITARLNRERVRLIMAKLERHRAAGRVRPDADLEAAAEMIAGLAFAGGFMKQLVMQIDRQRVRQLAAGAADLITRGLRTTSETARPHATRRRAGC